MKAFDKVQVLDEAEKPAAKQSQMLSILMPVYNERRTLRTIIDRTLSTPLCIPMELVVVDDASSDGSAEILKELASYDNRIKLITHPQNRGKAAAIRTAIAAMRGDIAIIQDADLEYDPTEIPRVLQPILDGKADASFGSRFANSEYRRVLYFWHSLANQVLTTITNMLCDLNLTDMETCYKAVRADILRQIPLQQEGFGIEPELTVRLAQWGARIYEVPISYSGRSYEEGKKITWKDGVHALWVLFWAAYINRRFTTHDGFYVLKSVRGAQLNSWMYEQFSRYVGQNILEAGCGIGNLTKHFLNRNTLICADIDPLYADLMSRRYGHMENFKSLILDISKPTDFEAIPPESLDTIICLNVLEHIDDDEQVLQNFNRLLRVGGHAIILVPQHEWLFCKIDEAVGHRRRYQNIKQLSERMGRAGFTTAHAQNFNKLGAIGWLVSGKLLGRRHLDPQQMWLFNQLIPIAKFVDCIPGLPALSIIVVGVKNSAAAE